MLLKLLPGIIIAAALGLFFSLPDGGKDGKPGGERTVKWSVDSARCDTALNVLRSVSASAAPSTASYDSGAGPVAAWDGSVLFGKRDVPAYTSFPAMDGMAAKTHAAKDTNIDPISAMNNMFRHGSAGSGNQVAEVAAATAHRDRGRTGRSATPAVYSPSSPAPPMRFGESVSSRSAFANFSGLACEDETSAWIPTSAYPEPPVKGIEVWASARHYKTRQDERESGLNIYSHDGDLYSFGLRKDWSIDSIIGVSMDILDAEVKGRYDNDLRKNEITGYLANAHYEGTFLGKYPVELKGTYGRIYHEGNGSFTDNITGLGAPWHEDRHRSHYYGFAAKAGLPFLFGGVFKVLPEIGVDWKKLDTDRYIVDVTAERNPVHHRDAMTSKSLMVPFTLTVKRDFKQCWGLVTPRAKVGFIREFEDSATGVRALHSTAASRPKYNLFTGELAKTEFEPSQKKLYQYGAGFDIRTVGGWDASADFMRTRSSEYTRDEFRLELGRCF